MLKKLVYRGENLEYEITGKGLPVMLVHGFTEDRRIWDPLLTGMKDKYCWMLPDLPGSGGSPYNSAHSKLKDFAEALKMIVDSENISELVLIGHSMGGYISLAFAEKYPAALRGLGLFHSSSYPDSADKKESRDKNIRFIQKNGAAAFMEQSLPGLYSDTFAAENPEEINKQIERYANCNPDSLVQYLAAMRERPATTEVLKSLTKPILFIMGEKDRAVPIKDALEQSHLPKISYIHILEQAAHMGMIEETSQCNLFVDQFLEPFPVL